MTYRFRLILRGALLVCTLSLLNKTDLRAYDMNAENFFSNQQLAAYHFAQQGETERLAQAVRAGVDLNSPGKEDMTLLGFAVLTAERRAIVSLMRAGADPNQVIPDAGSPAIFAIIKHFNPPRTDAVAALLEGGYDPNQLIGKGTPYLFFFVDYNHWSGFRFALEHGGDINVKRRNSESLLTYLIERHCYTQARELIANGAKVAARGALDETALLAIESDIRQANPTLRKDWREMLEMRELILSKLTDPKDRHTVFTDAAERKIQQNP
jgi:uncharacterized protein